MQLLFVTVDPDRDTPAVLAQYTQLFGPNIIGLRGTPDQLYALARRYRVVFSVVKTPNYEVTHSAAVYVFNAARKAAIHHRRAGQHDAGFQGDHRRSGERGGRLGRKWPLFEKSGAKTFLCWVMGFIGANAHGPA